MDNPIFEPKVLRWAREKRFGLSTEGIVKKLTTSSVAISFEQILDWETGRLKPKFSDIKQLAELYKRPLAVFFLTDCPEEEVLPPDLRTIGSKENKLLSPETLLVIRKARKIQDTANKLYSDLEEILTFKYPRLKSSIKPTLLAEKIRNDLLITIDDQFRFKKYEDFFEYLRRKIESTGIITLKSGMHDSFPREDCRAFSFSDKKPYLILVNNKDTEGAKIFSLLHEFAHVLLRESGICNNFNIYNKDNSINRLETFCNQFAASFLVPEKEFLKHSLLKNKTSISSEELDGIVNHLALNFKVSRFVILRRLKAFTFIDTETYRIKSDLWENELPPIHKDGGGQFSLKTILKKNGERYSTLVVDAYRKQKIPRSEASNYLGTKTKHLSNFEKLISSYGR